MKGYPIAHELFAKGFSEDAAGPCSSTFTCCEGGVYADVRERDRMPGHRELIALHMDATQTVDAALWFEDTECEDSDFPSGRRIATGVVHDKCAFFDRSGPCSLQVAATAAGMHKWTLKPKCCVLCPLDICDGVLAYDDMLQGEQQCCSVSKEFEVPVFRACSEELIHLLGEGGYQLLEQHYTSLQRSPLPSVTYTEG
jgi:hypothetical protein